MQTIAALQAQKAKQVEGFRHNHGVLARRAETEAAKAAAANEELATVKKSSEELAISVELLTAEKSALELALTEAKTAVQPALTSDCGHAEEIVSRYPVLSVVS